MNQPDETQRTETPPAGLAISGGPAMAAILAPLCAAGFAALCLSNRIYGPFGAAPGGANTVFWLAAGMGIGWIFRMGAGRPSR